MFSSKVISRRSAFKSLLIISVIPSLFFTSCKKESNSPVDPVTKNSLYKSNMDLELELAEKFAIRTSGEIEVPNKFIYKKVSKSYVLILMRGELEYLLKSIPVEVKSTKGNSVVIDNIGVGTILLANPDMLIKNLNKIDNKRLAEKFKAGKKFSFGEN